MYADARYIDAVIVSQVSQAKKPTKRRVAPNAGSEMEIRWYWQEGADRMDSHNKHDVLQPGNWVAYSWGVCAELNSKFDSWKAGTHSGKFAIDLTNRIASTGTEAKAHGGNTGVNFEIDFVQMHQKNIKSNFVRAVNRVGQKSFIGPSTFESTMSESSFLGGMESGGVASQARHPIPWLTNEEMVKIPPSEVGDGSGANSNSTAMLPGDLVGADDKLLYLRAGQLVQQHSIRDDGWAFGTVLHNGDAGDVDEMAAPPGVDFETGWFPIKHTEIATSEHLAKLQAALGDGALSALEPPADWGTVRDAMVAERFELAKHSDEFKEIAAFFKRTLHSSTSVVSVQRLQNMAMWQSYAMQRQLMATRDKKKPEDAEQRWLFHGTSADTVPKIIQQGFNRGFAGKNAVVYGAGVYFAKNASYSASTTYSPPDSKGVQSMFLVRVLSGFTCLGHNGQPVPDMRDASRNILYDTTTNTDKSIYVTYHDSQQYPEYLVQFR